MKLNQNFYSRPTRQVAQDLLGKFLIRKYQNKKYLGIITETEAYCGPQDKASHACLDGPKGRRASRGRTPRTEIMFGPAGQAYIYLIYGKYYCFNIVTAKEGYPAAVLIRAVQAFKPISTKEKINFKKLQPLPYHLTNGPGKLCSYFHLDKSLNGLSLAGSQLWVEDKGLRPSKIKKLPRLGIDYAEEYKDKKWRYLGEDLIFS